MLKSDGSELSVDRIERFNRALEEVMVTGEVRGEQLEDQEAVMLSISRELAGADLARLSKKRATVRERLMEVDYHARKLVSGKVRWALSLAVLVMVAAGSLALVPSLRAWAQEVIARVGHLLITDAPTYEEQIFEQLQATNSGDGRAFTVVPPSLEAVRARVDFPVLAPRNFPDSKIEDIYAPPWAAEEDTTWQSESVFSYSEGVTVSGVYKRWYSVNIHQLKAQDGQRQEFPVSSARVREVMVRSQRGYWVEDAPTGLLESFGSIWPSEGKESVWVLENQDMLIWEENGITYIIQADDELVLDDLLVIAEALSED